MGGLVVGLLYEITHLLLFGNSCHLQLVRRYTGGHKGSISCLMTFMASSGEVVLYYPLLKLSCLIFSFIQSYCWTPYWYFCFKGCPLLPIILLSCIRCMYINTCGFSLCYTLDPCPLLLIVCQCFLSAPGNQWAQI